MRFLAERWRRIGARLYLALGFAVFLTLVSGAVGVYYFEQSGDLNYQVREESVPSLEASWAAAREAERLRVLGLRLLSEPESGFGVLDADSPVESLVESLGRLESALGVVSGVPALALDARGVGDAAHDLAAVIDNLALNRDALLGAGAAAVDLRVRLEGLSHLGGSSDAAALSVLRQVLQADDEVALEQLWDEFSILHSAGIDPVVASFGNDQGVFAVRGQQLALWASIAKLAPTFDAASVTLDGSVSDLLVASRSHSSEVLGLAVSSFDQGRLLLTGISVVSVLAATLAAWLWVGNGMVRRLSRLSERMRGMADGDLETPVPEVGQDEIGELAGALEVFRQQALEVQRLNLVEQLYGELREANAELKRMQARLVAQEKLAALGELVSGVAHEITNPLNFVNNFSAGSLQLYKELSEMLENYRGQMTDDDTALMDDINEELTDSLNRVLSNGGRALAIVERMRGLGVVGGEPVLTNLNSVLRRVAELGCSSFGAESEVFPLQPAFELDPTVGEVPLVEGDFSEAVLSLVSNACYAMWLKLEDSGNSYQPVLSVSSHRVDDMVEVRVLDNGPGIADDVVGRIFNPFFSTREGIMGAGLGLPIAADVARRLGGDLLVDTVYGEYAEFTIRLPAASAVVLEAAEAI